MVESNWSASRAFIDRREQRRATTEAEVPDSTFLLVNLAILKLSSLRSRLSSKVVVVGPSAHERVGNGGPERGREKSANALYPTSNSAKEHGTHLGGMRNHPSSPPVCSPPALPELDAEPSLPSIRATSSRLISRGLSEPMTARTSLRVYHRASVQMRREGQRFVASPRLERAEGRRTFELIVEVTTDRLVLFGDTNCGWVGQRCRLTAEGGCSSLAPIMSDEG